MKRANPAPWITEAALAEQQHRVTPGDWAQFHAGRWGVSDAAWLPVGAWGACRDLYTVEEGEPVWCGVDVGGSRAASALVAVTADLRVVHAEAFDGNESVMQLPPAIRKLAETHRIQEVAYDPWRFQSEAIRLREDGVRVVEFPQSGSRMVPASDGASRRRGRAAATAPWILRPRPARRRSGHETGSRLSWVAARQDRPRRADRSRRPLGDGGRAGVGPGAERAPDRLGLVELRGAR